MKEKKTLNKAIIEIDEVEYLIDENASKLIKMKTEDIALIRMIDRKIFVFSLKEIQAVIKKDGIIDYLD